MEHLPSYLSTGQEVQGNQKLPDSRTTPAWGVLSMGCGGTAPSCSLEFCPRNAPTIPEPSPPLNKLMEGGSSSFSQ